MNNNGTGKNHSSGKLKRTRISLSKSFSESLSSFEQVIPNTQNQDLICHKNLTLPQS